MELLEIILCHSVIEWMWKQVFVRFYLLGRIFLMFWELLSAVRHCALYRRRLNSDYLSNQGAEMRFCDS